MTTRVQGRCADPVPPHRDREGGMPDRAPWTICRRCGVAAVRRRREHAKRDLEFWNAACRDRRAYGCHLGGDAVGAGRVAVRGGTGRARDPDAGSVLHASPTLGKIEVHINYDEVVDEFTYGEQSDWIDFQPGGARVTITADRAGFNYAIFDAVYPAPPATTTTWSSPTPWFWPASSTAARSPTAAPASSYVQASVALPAVNVTATGENRRSRPSSTTAGRRTSGGAGRDLRPRSDPGRHG